MVRFNALFVLAFGLLAASVTCLDDRASAVAIQGSGSGVNTRDLLGRRRRRRRNRRKSVTVNKNEEGVFIDQETDTKIHGDSNIVLGGQTGPIFNANVDVDEIEFGHDRKILSQDGGRDLLARRRRRHRRRRRNRNKTVDVNVNGEGVMVNQHTDTTIYGDGNKVQGGVVYPIKNINVDIGDEDDDKDHH